MIFLSHDDTLSESRYLTLVVIVSDGCATITFNARSVQPTPPNDLQSQLGFQILARATQPCVVENYGIFQFIILTVLATSDGCCSAKVADDTYQYEANIIIPNVYYAG